MTVFAFDRFLLKRNLHLCHNRFSVETKKSQKKPKPELKEYKRFREIRGKCL